MVSFRFASIIKYQTCLLSSAWKVNRIESDMFLYKFIHTARVIEVCLITDRILMIFCPDFLFTCHTTDSPFDSSGVNVISV